MSPNKRITLDRTDKIAILIGALFATALSMVIILSSITITSKNTNSVAKSGGSESDLVAQMQSGLGGSVLSPLSNSSGLATGTNTEKSTGQAQDRSSLTNTPGATTPLVAKPTKTKLAYLKTAENQLYTSDNRLFVTGNGGIFEIVARSASDVSVIDHTPKQRNCDFGGIVELSGVLYVNCSTLGPSYIYAAALTATPAFKQIYAFKSAILPNGLTVDNSGNLYDASMFAGQILRLTPSATNPLTFAKTGVWLNGTGLLTDGIKFYNDSIYWTDGQFMNRVAVKADGKPGQQTRLLTTAPTILDDLTINDDGILVADHVYGVIRKYDLNGHSTGTIPAKFTTPSSVLWARAPFPAGSLIVTERSANQVTLFTP